MTRHFSNAAPAFESFPALRNHSEFRLTIVDPMRSEYLRRTFQKPFRWNLVLLLIAVSEAMSELVQQEMAFVIGVLPDVSSKTDTLAAVRG